MRCASSPLLPTRGSVRGGVLRQVRPPAPPDGATAAGATPHPVCAGYALLLWVEDSTDSVATVQVGSVVPMRGGHLIHRRGGVG